MKMRTLLLGVFLGLLAAVHSTPVNTVTQNPANHDTAFLKDAMTEGFIVGLSPTLTTETPRINATVQASNSEDMIEGSAAGKIGVVSTTSITPHATTTPSMSPAQTSASAESPMFEGSGLGETSDESPIPFTFNTTTTNVTHAPTSDSTESYVFEGSAVESTIPIALDTTTTNVTHAPTSNSTESYVFEGSAVESTIPIALDTTTATHAPTSDFTERYMLKGRGLGYAKPSLFNYTTIASVPSEDQSSNTSNNNVVSQTTDPAASTGDVMTNQDSGSGSELDPTSSSSVESSIVSSIPSKQGRNFEHIEKAVKNTGLQSQQTQTQTMNSEPTHNGHVTPDWIIILGFIVGVAALVMLCVAIATRHKWNGPPQGNPTVATNNLSSQQREQEMETFLPNEKPKENGNSAEYTVIPLEDVPEHDPSH